MEQGGGAGRPHEVGGCSGRRLHPQLNFLVALGLSQAGCRPISLGWIILSEFLEAACGCCPPCLGLEILLLSFEGSIYYL